MTYLGPPILDIPPTTAVDTNGAVNSVVEGAAVNSLVGITASSTSALGFALTYSLTADTSGGGFKARTLLNSSRARASSPRR